MKKICIIGGGPSGLASARLFAEENCEVHVYDKRNHLGGNCYDEMDQHNILVHRYGPHYFRTNSEKLLTWLSQFTEWQPGRYFVRARTGNLLLPMPVGLATMTALKGEVFTEEKFKAYLDSQKVAIENPKNAEEQCLSKFGRELYELLFKGYTRKQWGVDPSELDSSITARIPLRFNWDERYPNENFQVIPKDGYTRMFRNMATHERISLFLGAAVDSRLMEMLRRKYDILVYTGALDEFFDYQFGKLQYRSLDFQWKTFSKEYVQPCVQINYPNDHEFTRTVEIKHVTGQTSPVTTVCYEYPKAQGEPYYPLLTPSNRKSFNQYNELARLEARKTPPIHFFGRLAEYKYFNMDHALLNSMKITEKILKGWKIGQPYIPSGALEE